MLNLYDFIINKSKNQIDSVLTKLETIEKAKIKRREAMAVILDKFNEVNFKKS